MRRITRAIINMAQSLKLKVIAEGVENRSAAGLFAPACLRRISGLLLQQTAASGRIQCAAEARPHSSLVGLAPLRLIVHMFGKIIMTSLAPSSVNQLANSSNQGRAAATNAWRRSCLVRRSRSAISGACGTGRYTGNWAAWHCSPQRRRVHRRHPPRPIPALRGVIGGLNDAIRIIAPCAPPHDRV